MRAAKAYRERAERAQDEAVEIAGASLRQTEKVMRRAEKATAEAIDRSEQSARRTWSIWGELWDPSHSANMARNWLAMSWTFWDAATTPMRRLAKASLPGGREEHEDKGARK